MVSTPGRSQPAYPGYRTSSLQDWALTSTCYLHHQTVPSTALGQWTWCKSPTAKWRVDRGADPNLSQGT